MKNKAIEFKSKLIARIKDYYASFSDVSHLRHRYLPKSNNTTYGVWSSSAGIGLGGSHKEIIEFKWGEDSPVSVFMRNFMLITSFLGENQTNNVDLAGYAIVPPKDERLLMTTFKRDISDSVLKILEKKQR